METIVLSHQNKKGETHRYVFRTDTHSSIETEIINWAEGELACDCARSDFIRQFFNKKFRPLDCDINQQIRVDTIIIDNEQIYSEI